MLPLLLVVQGRNVTRIVDKMLRNAFNLGYIQLTLPKACIVHTVRHPLDVALSCFSQPFEGRGLPWASQLDGEPLLVLLYCARKILARYHGVSVALECQSAGDL